MAEVVNLVSAYEKAWADCINDQLLDLQMQKQDKLAYGLNGVYETMNEFTDLLMLELVKCPVQNNFVEFRPGTP